MNKLWIDIETYSRVDLRKVSVYSYVEDDDFLILFAWWSVDGVNLQLALGSDEVLAIPGLLDPDVLKVAHNAQFERICFSRLAGLPVGHYLSPKQYHCTMAIAGEYGYPQRLEDLARTLKAEKKDTAGTRLINLFCKPNRKGERTLPEDKPEEWAEFLAYGKQDVVTLIDVDEKLGGWPNKTERRVYIADQKINDTGMAVDLEMAELAVDAADENRMTQELEISALTGVANPGSQQQMLAWLKSSGLKIDNLQAATIESLLAGELEDDQRVVLELRQELALVASKKFATTLDAANSDGRLRGGFRFFGAHTGRWAGRGVQPHNLPRAQLDSEELTEAAILDLKLGLGADAHTLKALVRAMFTGPLTVVDYAAIEARVVAWLAGEEWALQAFRDGRDIYVETAERMGGLTRAQGKVAVLALGYNGGINSLKAMGGVATYYDPKTGQAIHGGSLGESASHPMRDMTDDEYQGLVNHWRRANPKIVRLWRTMGDAVGEAGPVGPHLSINRSGSTMQMNLPSGRLIEYHGLKWEKYRVRDPKTGRMLFKEGWRYDDPKKPGVRIGTYGGRLVENATQAVARDIMAEALVRLQSEGFTVVGHVHDEVLVDGEHDVAEISSIMTEVPSWATDMPIDGEGFTCARYKKG